MNEHSQPGFAEVLAAAARIASHATVTPVLRSRELDAMAGASLHFKGEHLQRGGAFKFRGACNAVWSLDPEQAQHGVVTHSSGNHGAALALAARSRGIPCHVVVPEGAVATKLANIVRHGATLWRCAPTQAAREAECARVQQDTGATLVHPYADARVIAGQGTAALELARQAGATLDVLVVPVGGGGLAAGTLLAMQQVDFVPDTVCDGLRGALGRPNFALLNGHAQVITVDDDATVAAMRLIWQVMKQVVEPSSAITLAAVLAQPQRFSGRNVGLILTGGNVDLDALPWAVR